LKAGVSDQEGTEDPPQPLVAESVLRADLQACDGYVGAVEKGNSTEYE
jgi:hypothetical protein